MNMVDEDNDARRERIVRESNKIIKEIEDFNCETSSAKELARLFTRSDEIKEELEDMINTLEVEHFLEFGPGKNDV